MKLSLDTDALEGGLPEPGDFRVLLTAKAIEAAIEREDSLIAKVDTLIDEVGVHVIVEALRRRHILIEDWR